MASFRPRRGERGRLLYLVWFEGRNTASVVGAESRSDAIAKLRKTGRAGSQGKVVKARRATESERKLANAGKWLRVRPDGSDPTSSKTKKRASRFKSKFRSGPAQQSKG